MTNEMVPNLKDMDILNFKQQKSYAHDNSPKSTISSQFQSVENDVELGSIGIESRPKIASQQTKKESEDDDLDEDDEMEEDEETDIGVGGGCLANNVITNQPQHATPDLSISEIKANLKWLNHQVYN